MACSRATSPNSSPPRGWSLVLVGGLGSIGGYFAASGVAALLEPIFSWRILWLMNLPTGLALVLLGGLIPESAQFLLARGRKEEARQVMAKFGAMARATRPDEIVELARSKATALTGHAFFGKLLALSLAAICYGLVNFGLLLWLPADLVAKGYSMELTGTLLAESALIALPTIFVTAYAYSRWSTKWSVAGAIAVTIAGLGLVSAVILIPTAAALALVLWYGKETRGRDLRDLDPDGRTFAATGI